MSIAQFLYVEDGNFDGTPGFAVSLPMGALTPLPGSPFGTFHGTPFGGRDADVGFRAMAFLPSGRALYGYGSNDLWRYDLDPSTGVLSGLRKVGAVTLTSGPFSLLAIDPSGRFLYHARGARIAAYAIDAASGELSLLPGSPFSQAADGNLTQLVIPPQGRFLYAVNAPFPSRLDMSNIWAYAIDAVSGALAAIPDSPFLQSQSVASGQGEERTLRSIRWGGSSLRRHVATSSS